MTDRFSRKYTDWWRAKLIKAGLSKEQARKLVAAWNCKLTNLAKKYPKGD